MLNLRIGINTLFFVPGDVGGTEIYLRNNLLHMVEQHPQVLFVLLTARDNEAVLAADFSGSSNVEFVQLPFRAANRPLRIVAEQLLLPHYVRKSGIDVLWSPGYTAPGWCSCPQVVTIHDLQYKSFPDDMSWPERVALDFLVRLSCRRCEAVIAVSEFSRDEITRFGFAGEDKIHVVLEGVDRRFAVPSIEKGDTQVRSPYILCVAHTYPHKNVHLLIEAYAHLQTEIPHDLIIVGKARRGENKVVESLKLLKEPDRVQRLSGLEFTDLQHLYQQADLFVLPSAYEGFGLPVLEAMMAGTLVITSNVASLAEVCTRHVLYCEPLSAGNLAEVLLKGLRMDSEQKERMQAEGQSWAGTFTWSRSAQKTMKVLQARVESAAL